MTAANLLNLAVKARALAGTSRPARTGGDWYRVRNADGDRARLYIYGYIGDDWSEDDVTAGGFTRALNEITAPAIDLHVNSPGGSVWDGIAIYSALLEHPATVDVSIDGVAASAAAFVSMAGDTRAIQKPAQMMIHNTRGIAIGDAEVMRDYADLLDQLTAAVAEIFTDRAGGELAGWQAAMAATTWYTADQAVAAGLAHRVVNDTTTEDSATPDNRRSQMIRARARVTLGRAA